MSAREAILRKVRASLGAAPDDAHRSGIVAQRLARPPGGVIPARGQLGDKERVELFCAKAEEAAATVRRVGKADEVPRAVLEYLRSKNLPASVRMGEDRRLGRMPWKSARSLEIKTGPADPEDEVGLSHAFAGVAESGTVVLFSGEENPTTVNFLPEYHVVVVDAKEIAGDLETVIGRIRDRFGRGEMPRTLNMITGPSRSGDIEQKLLLGAHGPRAVHVVVVG